MDNKSGSPPTEAPASGIADSASRTKRPSFGIALIPLVAMAVLLGVGYGVYKIKAQVLLVAAAFLTGSMGFLLGFETSELQALITADNYFGFVGTLFLAFGLTMEFPIVLVILSKVGIISSARLSRSRRYVVLGIAIFSAVVTPGGDLVSPIVLGVVMYVLYELSIVLVRAGGR